MKPIKRVLVTGATGYIGRNVVQALLDQTECEIVAVSRSSGTRSATPRLKWVSGDLLDEKDCRKLADNAGAQCLIHLAWYAEHPYFWTAAENLRWVRATLSLLEDFKETGGERAVFAGTCAEYDSSYGYCIEDKTPLEPHTFYGRCKDATRRLVSAYCDANDLGYAWGRLFYPYGLGEPPARLVPSVISALLENRPVQCSHGAQFRDFLHVGDAASAFAHLATKTAATGDFNVASGMPVRIRDLVTLCADLAHSDASPQFGALAPPVHDPAMLVGDNRKLIDTGWSPRIGLADGLQTLIAETKSGAGNR
jgi:nucleoside-diphosphate-sugar epimerase